MVDAVCCATKVQSGLSQVSGEHEMPWAIPSTRGQAPAYLTRLFRRPETQGPDGHSAHPAAEAYVFGISREANIYAGGSAYVADGGVMSGATVNSGGAVIIDSGGSSYSDTIAVGGNEYVLNTSSPTARRTTPASAAAASMSMPGRLQTTPASLEGRPIHRKWRIGLWRQHILWGFSVCYARRERRLYLRGCGRLPV